MRNKLKNSKAFTLIEIMIVIGILATLTSSFVKLFNSEERRVRDFEQEMDNMILLYRTMRNYAMSNKAIDLGTGDGPLVYDGGFGVYLDRTNKTLRAFMDTNNDGKYIAADDYEIPQVALLTLDRPTNLLSVTDNTTQYQHFTVIFTAGADQVIISKNDGVRLNDAKIHFAIASRNMELEINKISKFFVTNYY